MKLLRLLVPTAAVLWSAAAFAQPFKVGVINGNRILAESEMSRTAAEQMKKEFGPREEQLRDLQKQGLDLKAELERDGEKMKPADRQAKEKRLAGLSQQFEQLQRSFGEDIEFRQREVRMRIIGEINTVMQAIAEAEKYDLILPQAVHGGAEIDLTERVLKEMARRAGGAPR